MNLINSTILVVEDDSNDVLLLQRAFRKANINHSLQILADGEQVLHYLQGQGSYSDRTSYPLPFLMFLDLKLPRFSGLEVLEWVRQQPNFKRLPVIVLSSSRENLDINTAYELGANSYLVKPVSFDQLSEMIKVFNAYWLSFNNFPSS